MLERYRYMIALGGIGLLLLPRVPASAPVNGAYLAIRIGSLSFQPAEFAKIAIVIFLASYLRDTRQLLVIAGRRVLGVTIPPLKHFGPLLVIWGAAMVLLFYIRDIGSSVMFFGGVPGDALRGDRPPVVRRHRARCCSPLGACFLADHIGHIARPHRRLAAPVRHRAATTRRGGSYQLAQGLFAQADGGLFGQGFGQRVLRCRKSAGTATARCCRPRTPTSSTR